MVDKKEVIGYFTDDRNIYCVECINKNREIMEKIEKAITVDDAEEGGVVQLDNHKNTPPLSLD